MTDVAVAVGVAALIGVELGAHWDDGYSAGPLALNLPLLLFVTIPLAIRRRHPALAVALGYAVVIIPSLVVAHTVFFFGTLVPLLLLTYTAARQLEGRQWLATLAAPALLLVAVPLHQPDFDVPDYLFWIILSGAVVAMGRLMHRLDRQRQTLARLLATQVQDQQAREHALLLDERARIARELHDVVAHSVSVMVVQAGAARLAVGVDDDEAREGMHAVEEAGRHALLDLRRLLGVLRPDPDQSAVTPAPGLAMLDDLVARMRAAGLEVTLELTGVPSDLPAGLDLSAYRIVQEALTNVLKHCGPTAVRVAVDFADDLTLSVEDAGPAADAGRTRRPLGSGHGMIGMRERAAVFGGTFAAGPQGRGWRVVASLPLPVGDRVDLR